MQMKAGGSWVGAGCGSNLLPMRLLLQVPIFSAIDDLSLIQIPVCAAIGLRPVVCLCRRFWVVRLGRSQIP